MSAELHQLRERCDAFDALADALRTPDSWLSYRAEALRDQLQECERQAAACPSTLEWVCTALIDRDEALRQARADLERMRTLATNWEAEVTTVRAENQEVRAWLQEAQAQQSQAEERARAAEQRAKAADELKATLDAKVAALAIAEDRLLQECTARQGAEGQLQQERATLVDARSALERERTACEAVQKSLEERNVEFSKLEGELVVLSITSASQEQALKEQSDTVNGLQQAVEAECRALEVERKQVEGTLMFVFCFADFPLEGSPPFLISFLLATFRPAHRAGARDRAGRGTSGLLQLLRAGAGGAALCGPRDLPGRGGGRSAGWELAGQPPARPRRACLRAHAPGAAPRHLEGPRSGAISLRD
jgi:regulator of replication initiation timing